MECLKYSKQEPLIREIMKTEESRRVCDEEPMFELESFVMPKQYSAIRDRKTGRTVGIIEDETMFLLGDRVELRADSDGFIAPGILQEGEGVITKVRLNGAVRYGIQMDNGEFGYITSRYIWKKLDDESDSE